MVPAVLVVEVERLAAVEVVEEEVELQAGMEELVDAEEAGIFVAETRTRMEAGAVGTRTVRVMHAQHPVISSITLGSWEFA